MLNDTPDPNNPDGATLLQLDYYRQKVVEFQGILDQMDAVANIANSISWESTDKQLAADMDAYLLDFDNKKGSFRTAAEALNFAINGINAAGISFPRLQVPQGLGVVPLVAAAGVAGALAVAAALIVWGRDWIASVTARAKLGLQLDAIKDPAQRARVAEDLARLDQAQSVAEASPISSVASIVKWVAIAAVAYFAIQSYQALR